jgi:YjbE family integral membrane protein
MGNVSGGFFFSLASIVLIDILLAGDNAVVIAMAVRSLPPPKRRIGVLMGAGGAVVLRIILTFLAVRFLELPFIKLIGGLLILWIAVKLLTQHPEDGEQGDKASSVGEAIRLILIADLTMSLDNILAVAASSQGNLVLLGIGLALSISFVVFTSGILSRIMDRFPIVIWLGGAILGRVAGQMIMSDPWVLRLLQPAAWLRFATEMLLAAAVVIAGWSLRKNKPKKPSPANVS